MGKCISIDKNKLLIHSNIIAFILNRDNFILNGRMDLFELLHDRKGEKGVLRKIILIYDIDIILAYG